MHHKYLEAKLPSVPQAQLGLNALVTCGKSSPLCDLIIHDCKEHRNAAWDSWMSRVRNTHCASPLPAGSTFKQKTKCEIALPALLLFDSFNLLTILFAFSILLLKTSENKIKPGLQKKPQINPSQPPRILPGFLPAPQTLL